VWILPSFVVASEDFQPPLSAGGKKETPAREFFLTKEHENMLIKIRKIQGLM